MFPLGWLNQLLGLAMNGIDWCMYHLLECIMLVGVL